MLIYIILIVVIIFSFITGIITTIMEKKEIENQKKRLKEDTLKITKQQNMSEVLSKTLQMSSITKKVDQIDLSESKIDEKEYYTEPIIVAVLEDDVSLTK